MNHSKLSIVLLLSLSGAAILAMEENSKPKLTSKEKAEAKQLAIRQAMSTEGAFIPKSVSELVSNEKYVAPETTPTAHGPAVDVNNLCLTATLPLQVAVQVRREKAALLAAELAAVQAASQAEITELQRRAIARQAALDANNMQIEILKERMAKLPQEIADHEAIGKSMTQDLAKITALLGKTDEQIVQEAKEEKAKTQPKGGFFSTLFGGNK